MTKIAIINLNPWNSANSTPRPSQKLSITVPSKISRLKVERLTGPGTDASGRLIWAGIEWIYLNVGVGAHIKNDVRTVSVESGMVTVEVQVSEAILASVVR